MNLTISMNTVLNFLHALELSTSQKQWLADKLYEEMNTERKAVATTASGWPKIRREDIHISPEVMKLGTTLSQARVSTTCTVSAG